MRTTRGTRLRVLPRSGRPFTIVQVATGQDPRPALRDAAPGGYDVVVDLLWGEPVVAAIDATKVGACIVQVSNQAGPSARLNAGAFRNKLVTIVGYTGFLAPRAVKRSAFARLAQPARDREVTVELEQVSLDHVAEAWARLQAGASRKLVVIP